MCGILNLVGSGKLDSGWSVEKSLKGKQSRCYASCKNRPLGFLSRWCSFGVTPVWPDWTGKPCPHNRKKSNGEDGNGWGREPPCQQGPLQQYVINLSLVVTHFGTFIQAEHAPPLHHRVISTILLFTKRVDMISFGIVV